MAEPPSIFIAPGQIHGDRFLVSGGDALHLLRVLRLAPGDRFRALDGTGLEYTAVIVTVDREELEAVVEERTRRETEARLRVTLGQALPKSDKMEQVIRKCTELGLAAFWPIMAERCVPLPPRDRFERRLARWERIAAEAARQSGRSAPPPVEKIRTWEEAAASFGAFDLVLLPWEGERETSLKAVLASHPRPENVLILIGAEGGLTRPEVELARSSGAGVFTLGPRILRTETAGLVVSSALFFHYGELELPAKPLS